MARFSWNKVVKNFTGDASKGLGNVSNANFSKAAKKNPAVSSASNVDDVASAKTAVNGKTTPNGKTVDDLVADPNLKNAMNANPKKISRLAIKGVAGLAALMILTGNDDPVDAIDDAYNKTTDAAKESLNLFDKIINFFTSYGMYMSLSCVCSICMIIIIMVLIGSTARPMRRY